ncbi:MAG TPA: hypothetical protein VK454_08410 [Myxococcaceae bacterium]|nr:hypothetical protein [Myxococcaceae bacterium]
MRKSLIGLAAAVLAVAASGCSSSSSNTYTCDFSAAVGFCYEWSTASSLSSSEISQLQAACTGGGAGGTFSTGTTCSSTNRVGQCTFSNFGVSGVSYIWVLYSPTYTATTGQTFCTQSGGSWTAG